MSGDLLVLDSDPKHGGQESLDAAGLRRVEDKPFAAHWTREYLAFKVFPFHATEYSTLARATAAGQKNLEIDLTPKAKGGLTSNVVGTTIRTWHL